MDVRTAAVVALGNLVERGEQPARLRLGLGFHERLDDDPVAALPTL